MGTCARIIMTITVRHVQKSLFFFSISNRHANNNNHTIIVIICFVFFFFNRVRSLAIAQVRWRKDVGHGVAGPTEQGENVSFHNRTRGQTSVGKCARSILHQLESSGDYRALQHAVARVHKRRRPRQQAVPEGFW